MNHFLQKTGLFKRYHQYFFLFCHKANSKNNFLNKHFHPNITKSSKSCNNFIITCSISTGFQRRNAPFKCLSLIDYLGYIMSLKWVILFKVVFQTRSKNLHSWKLHSIYRFSIIKNIKYLTISTKATQRNMPAVTAKIQSVMLLAY